MKNRLGLVFAIILSMSCFNSYSQIKFNGSFEDLYNHQPIGWQLLQDSAQTNAYRITLDSNNIKEGKYSLKIENINGEYKFGTAEYLIRQRFQGKKLTLKGFIKTEGITSGFANLWMRLESHTSTLGFADLHELNIKENSGWKQFSIELPYDDNNADDIIVGADLFGNGKAWFDNLEVYVDDVPIEKAALRTPPVYPADADKEYAYTSRLDTIMLSKRSKQNLVTLGKFWGFVKYHSDQIAQGKINWDAALFRALPDIIYAKSDGELSDLLEKMLPDSGKNIPQTANHRLSHPPVDYKLNSDFNIVREFPSLKTRLISRLKQVEKGPSTEESYYVGIQPNIGNIEFKHENPYPVRSYPDVGVRLLSLYRYWAMIEYFYPYRDLIGDKWNTIFNIFIPKFIYAKDATEYTLAVLQLIGTVKDTHANIWGENRSLDNFKGEYMLPVKTTFIDRELVITGFYSEMADSSIFKKGDIIRKINGDDVSALIKKFSALSPASNVAAMLRDLPKNFLLRSKINSFQLEVSRGENKKSLQAFGTLFKKINFESDFRLKDNEKYFYLLNKKTGYLYAGNYKNKDLETIKKTFENVTGLIIDMRCYPGEFMPYTFGNFIKSGASPFAKLTLPSINRPGGFYFTQPATNGGSSNKSFKAEVIVLVNEKTQSQAEFTTMALQSSKNVRVLGSITAGADGNVSPITLPGNIYTMISAIGIYYPDEFGTQRTGVKIDYPVKPTLDDIRNGRDRLLIEALKILKNHNL